MATSSDVNVNRKIELQNIVFGLMILCDAARRDGLG